MIIEIPVRGDLPWFSLVVELDGTDYRLEFHWNTRDSRWYLSVGTTDGTALVSGIAVVVDESLLQRFVSEDLPPGMLMAVDGTEQGREIEAQEDLGVRVRLVYVPEADL